ncbi:MAG: ABC transporter ATP-binding protein [Deinococcota bacterium]|jgi:putative ABC transport system ATP-binding protein|nr:ABC transporter ATP-binding protein [Deinococcota bacterium]
MKLIELRGISKHYGAVIALDDLSLELRQGDFLSIIGPSGSGKTTLLGILGLLETPSAGSYLLEGQPVSELDEAARSRLRNRGFGFVFQQFSLIPNLNAWQNVARPLVYARVPKREQRARALELLERLGLAHRAEHRPAQLSGGEQQRVAIARALVNDPDIILADEPTGNLLEREWESVLEVFEALNRLDKTIVMTTHEPSIASRATTRLCLRNGRIVPCPAVSALSPSADLPSANLQLDFLGVSEAVLDGEPLPLTLRTAEIMALLAQHPEGLSAQQLLLLLYGEKGNPGTLRATLSKLRTLLPIASRPYRLTVSYRADFLRVESLLKEGRLQEAVEFYRGELLPDSEAPGIALTRETLHESLRQAVLVLGDTRALLTLAERLDDDLELWEAALEGLAEDDPKRALVQARVERIRRAWSESP